MCRFYDPAVTEQCTEDDAEEVREKERANFCDYFRPGTGAFDPAALEAENRAKSSLDSLFGESADHEDDRDEPGPSDAEDLFR